MVSQEFANTLQGIVNLPSEEKVRMAATCYSRILPVFQKISPDRSGQQFVCAVVGATVGADGVITPQEKELVQAIYDVHGVKLSDADVARLVGQYAGQSWRRMVRTLASMMGDNKSDLIYFIAAVCAIDNRISPDEVSFLEELLFPPNLEDTF